MELLIDLNCDILLVSETWLSTKTNYVTSQLKDYGYKLLHTIRNYKNKCRGGVGVLHKMAYKSKSVFLGKYDSFEYHCCVFSLHGTKNLYVIVIYRLQDISTSLFFDEFVSFLEIICSFDGYIILGGDANIHLDIALDCDTKKFLDICYTFNLLQLVDSITHNKGHQLDFLITNNKKIIKDVYLNNISLSDHYLIQFKYSNQIQTSPQYKTVHTRNYKNLYSDFCAEQLVSSLQQLDSQISTNASLDTVTDLYHETVANIVERYAPLKTLKIKNVPKSPWFDYEYVELKKKWRKAEKQFKTSNDAADKNIYIKFRKETTKLAKTKKVNYFREKINKSSNSQRELFRAVQSLTDSISVNQFPSEQLCDKTIAENFSNFFVTKVNRIHNALLKKKCDYQVHFPLKKVDEI